MTKQEQGLVVDKDDYSRHSIHNLTWEKYENLIKAWKKGQNPWISVRNGNTSETNKFFVKVKANDYFGDPRQRFFISSN